MAGGPRGDQPGRNIDDRLLEKLSQISGPTFELPPLDTSERKFAGRNRLYIGNISNDITEDDILELFKSYGETSELFLNKEKNFGFLKFVSLKHLIYLGSFIKFRYKYKVIMYLQVGNFTGHSLFIIRLNVP